MLAIIPATDEPSLAEQGRAMIADADAAIAKGNAKPEEAYKEQSNPNNEAARQATLPPCTFAMPSRQIK